MVNTVITPTGIAPLSILTSTDHPTSQQYFQYAQLSHFLKGEPHLLRGTRAHTKYETYCTTHSLQIKHLSIFYRLLNTINLTPPPPFTAAWETELGITIPVGTWHKIFIYAHTTSISTAVRESTYKRISRWHYSPAKVHAIFPTAPDTCWRCGQPKGTTAHIWWLCPAIQTYWRGLGGLIKAITGHQLPQSPETFLFLVHTTHIPNLQRKLVNHLLTAANMLIPLKWKSTRAPSVREWIQKVEFIRTMEELDASYSNKYTTYTLTWQPWLTYLGNRAT
ncbi:Hypothetical predicted protein [Pelobates cultripes]|uniref:Reverse transcriptase zinc-binding domain-containing protein n=1 Tax=Pelobates cultripes TaxID=61616 RepID=A0AAD1RBQ5_PELCU|nr:Hypothetical predicted protein [Pelobates cultripes]